jgi:N-methylhydantoinase B
VIAVSTPGGGGFGAPAARPRHAVERDVALGYYRREEAELAFARADAPAGAHADSAPSALPRRPASP